MGGGEKVNKQMVAAGFSPTGKTSMIYATHWWPGRITPNDGSIFLNQVLMSGCLDPK